MPEILEDIEAVIRDASTPPTLNDICEHLPAQGQACDRRLTRDAVLLLLDRGVLTLGWDGKIRTRAAKAT